MLSSFSSSSSGVRAGSVLIVGAAALWGTTGAVMVLAPEGASPVSAGAARIVLGGALLVLAAGRSLAALLATARRGALGPLVLGAAGVAVSQTTYFVAVDRTGVAVATLVTIGSAPAFAGLLGLPSGVRPSRRWLTATGLAIAGVALLAGGGAADPAGIVLALISGCAYAVQSVAAARLVRAWRDPLAAAGGVFGLAGAALLPVLAAGDLSWLASAGGVAAGGYLGAVTTSLAYLLYFRGLRTTEAATATTLTLVEPAIAAVLGLLFLGEHLSAAGGAGLILVAAGLVLLLRE